MPKSYLEQVVEKESRTATLRKQLDETVALHPTQNFIVASDIEPEESIIYYIPTPTKYIVRIKGVGWQDYVDTVITVSPDLDISVRNKVDADTIVFNGREYRVMWVEDDGFARHKNRMVGLKALADGQDV